MAKERTAYLLTYEALVDFGGRERIMVRIGSKTEANEILKRIGYNNILSYTINKERTENDKDKKTAK